MQPSATLAEAVAVTAELCGRTFSEAAARVFLADLAAYPEPAVLRALVRCRREVRGMLTLADVVQRLDDGRPGSDEAWAMIPQDEAGSVVWSDEMAQAWGIAAPLLPDRVAARMAFREAYVRAVALARDRAIPVRWTPSLGHDPRSREAAVVAAIEAGRLSADDAAEFLPAPKISPEVLRISENCISAINRPKSRELQQSNSAAT